jgi:hypothetical protein
MERTFLDANVMFLASYRERAALTILWQLPDVRLLTSTYILQEIWHNVAEAGQRVRLASLITAMELVAELAENEPLAKSSGLPAKDVPVLHAAISGRATHLVTADVRHFGPLLGTTIGGVLVQLPADYLRGKAGGQP